MVFFLTAKPASEIYTLSLHDALPISTAKCCGPSTRRSRRSGRASRAAGPPRAASPPGRGRSEEHTSELQSLRHLVCRLLLEKKNEKKTRNKKSQDDKEQELSRHVQLR